MKLYVNAYPDTSPMVFTTAAMAEAWAGCDAHLVAFEVEIPDPPAEPDDPADMLIMLADMARDMETSSPADAERIEWALAEIHRLQVQGVDEVDRLKAEIHRLQGKVARRDYYLGCIRRDAACIVENVGLGLEDPS